MLALPKKTDYALIALHFLLERPGRVAPAREIAEAYHLPCALLMNVMKELQQGGLVKSIRGAKGGYTASLDPYKTTLYDVVVLTSGEPLLTECCNGDPDASFSCQVGSNGATACPVAGPLKGLHQKLVGFLKDVKLADLLLKNRVDVTLNMVGVS